MPSSHTFTAHDPHAYGAKVRGVNSVEVLPTTKGKFQGELMHINLHRLWLQRGRENLPRILGASVSAERSAIEFPIGTGQPASRYRGIDVSPGEIVVHDSDWVHRRTFAPCHWGSMSLTPAELAATGSVLAGRELTRPSVMRVLRPAPALMARLLSLHEDVAKLAKTAPDKLVHPEVARSLEQGLIHAMIRCLTEGASAEMRPSSRHHSAAIARLEELVAANHDRALYLAEICMATGVSERTLRVCCQEHLGMGPVRYLWLRRMHLARRTLVRADPAMTTVTEIATEYGFWELGRFSVQYRALFGESPSASLRRPPDDRRTAQGRPQALADSEFA